MSGVVDPNNQISVANALVPPEGPKVVPTQLDFSTAGIVIVDFTLPQMQKRISVIQTVIVRNWNNPNPLTITVDGTSQMIDVPANSDVTTAVLAAIRPKFVVQTVSGVIVPVIWLNVPLPSLYVPNTGGGSSQVTVVGTVDVDVLNTVTVTGTVNAVSAAGSITPANADASSITTGGTAVSVFASGGGVIVNPDNATESLFIDIVNSPGTVAPGTSGTTVELVAGQSFTTPRGTTTATRANAVTNGHTFSAYKTP